MSAGIGKKAPAHVSTGSWRNTVEELTGKPLEPSRPATGIAYLLLDVSPSMEGKKLADAIEGAVGFAEDAIRKGYAVGIIRFAGTAAIVSEPSQNVVPLTGAVRRLTLESATRIAPPLAIARNELASLPLKRAVVLFTDGEAQDQPEALEAAKAVKEEGIDIITIGTEDADRSFLQRIATRTDLAVATTTRSIAASIRATAGLLHS